ncbi:MAG: 16S rRNA (uracil(1498)-N(3))-methyltransferase [Patescibacteria group bacterium]|nr:16S rRNA (uracil(1498)-N(3))-methyltransferase [Patescibacteria group bacterium]
MNKSDYNLSENQPIELFYVAPNNVREGLFTIVGDEFHHARRVLRKRTNDTMLATDGLGMEYMGIIRQVTADRIICEIQKARRRPREPFTAVTLLVGMLKSHRFSIMVEKTTEIGVNRIIPILAEHCEAGESTQKISHWKAIAKAAMKQSGRSILPEIDAPLSFREAIEHVFKFPLKLIAHPCQASKQMNTILAEEAKKNLSLPVQNAVIAIGPEGGFSQNEADMAIANQFLCVSLGSRRLRSETAACVALTSLLFHQGEF